MNVYICLTVLFEVSSIFALSVLTGSESKNMTYSDETVREVKNFDVLRQLLNQETIIRMSMAKDMLSLKQSLVGEVSTLKQTTVDLKNDLQKLERENAKCKENVNYVLENSDEMNKTIVKLRDESKQSKQNLSSAVSSLELLRTNISKTSRDYSVKVAFTAGMPSSSSTFSKGTMVFPTVITNIGGGYNPSTGIFTAPNDGLYVFYVSGLEYSKQQLVLDIVLNGESKVRLLGYSAAAAQTGTNMAVLNLQQGDKVWVKHTEGKGYYSLSVPFTTFSGFQI